MTGNAVRSLSYYMNMSETKTKMIMKIKMQQITKWDTRIGTVVVIFGVTRVWERGKGEEEIKNTTPSSYSFGVVMVTANN